MRYDPLKLNEYDEHGIGAVVPLGHLCTSSSHPYYHYLSYDTNGLPVYHEPTGHKPLHDGVFSSVVEPNVLLLNKC